MMYKTPNCESELKTSPISLQAVVQRFEEISISFGIEPMITRVWQGVCGDSGVHEAHRGCDLRDETYDGDGDSHFVYSPGEVQQILDALNEEFPRTDELMTCKHHSFEGGPHHFHVQVQVHPLPQKTAVAP